MSDARPSLDLVATGVLEGASSAAADTAGTVDTANMAVATEVDVEGIMVVLEEARARVRAKVSPAVPVTVEVSADPAH